MNQMSAPPVPEWLARELPDLRYRVDLGAWRMHVMESGVGPTVLMLHGNPTWGYLYRKVAAALGPGLRLVIPDLIGLGLSDKPRHACEHTLEHHIGWVGRLVDRLDLRDVTLVCQDWGGPIGLGAFAERPGRLRSIVLLNTVVSPPRPGFRPTAFHRFARTPLISDLAFRGLQFPQAMLGVAQGDRASIGLQATRAYMWPLRHIGDRRAPLAMARMVPDSPLHESIPALRRVERFVTHFDGPVEIVWGDRDPVLGTAIRHIERLLPAARVTRTQAGHFLQEEVPGVIAQAVWRAVG